MKTMIVISDLHCGHLVGLTPPGWWSSEEERPKYRHIQEECAKWFIDEIESVKKNRRIDIMVSNGDLVDGAGGRNCGRELLDGKLESQIKMAKYWIDFIGARQKVFIKGTPYHTSVEGLHVEEVIAGHYKEKAHTHEWLEVSGIKFDFKHKINSSSVPHGRFTAPARAMNWANLWAKTKYTPECDFIIRSHVHYFGAGQQITGDKIQTFMTTPALQAMGSEYGALQCEGLVDFGFMVFTFDKGKVSWEIKFPFIQAQATQTRVLV
mgnify:CR=1 FL=1